MIKNVKISIQQKIVSILISTLFYSKTLGAIFHLNEVMKMKIYSPVSWGTITKYFKIVLKFKTEKWRASRSNIPKSFCTLTCLLRCVADCTIWLNPILLLEAESCGLRLKRTSMHMNFFFRETEYVADEKQNDPRSPLFSKNENFQLKINVKEHILKKKNLLQSILPIKKRLKSKERTLFVYKKFEYPSKFIRFCPFFDLKIFLEVPYFW